MLEKLPAQVADGPDDSGDSWPVGLRTVEAGARVAAAAGGGNC